MEKHTVNIAGKKKKLWKRKTKRIVLELFTTAEEIPFHRHLLATTITAFHAQIPTDLESFESKVSALESVISQKDNASALKIITSIKTGFNFLKSGNALETASFYAYVKSINGKDLQKRLTVDDCFKLAEKYSNYINLDVIQKKNEIIGDVDEELKSRGLSDNNNLDYLLRQYNYIKQAIKEFDNLIFEGSDKMIAVEYKEFDLSSITPNSSEFIIYKSQDNINACISVIQKFYPGISNINDMSVIEFFFKLKEIRNHKPK